MTRGPLIFAAALVSSMAVHIAVLGLQNAQGMIEVEGGAIVTKDTGMASFSSMASVASPASPPPRLTTSAPSTTPQATPAKPQAQSMVQPVTQNVQAPAVLNATAQQPTKQAPKVSKPALQATEPTQKNAADATKPTEVQDVKPPIETAQPLERASETPQRAASNNSSAAKARNTPDKKPSKRAGNAAASNYPGQVNRRLARQKKPRVRKAGEAFIAFTVAANGRLTSSGVAKSSGDRAFDQLALKFVKSAAPFPKPPAGAQTSFTVRIVFKP